jgi:hypothetical protein
MVFGVPIDLFGQREVMDQVSMITDGVLLGTDRNGIATGTIHFVSCSDDSPSMRKERVAPALGDTDACGNIFTSKIRYNQVCDLLYLQWMYGCHGLLGAPVVVCRPRKNGDGNRSDEGRVG